MRITDGENGRDARNEGASCNALPQVSDEPRDAACQPEQAERPNPGDARPGLQRAKVEAAFDTDQQSARERRGDAKCLPIPIGGQLNRSACQRRWSAMKLEIK